MVKEWTARMVVKWSEKGHLKAESHVLTAGWHAGLKALLNSRSAALYQVCNAETGYKNHMSNRRLA